MPRSERGARVNYFHHFSRSLVSVMASPLLFDDFREEDEVAASTVPLRNSYGE